jgi:hypothetical protein
MEVHHHTHHPKKWKEYFWEFFMLFLAVFCGFLAEIQVEHYVEHQREKQYMITMLEDLRSDTAMLNQNIQARRERIVMCDSLVLLLNDSNKEDHGDELYFCARRASIPCNFFASDRTVQQLKNSGNLRLIRNKVISNNIMSYDQNMRSGSFEMSDEIELRSSYRVSVVKVFNTNVFNSMVDSDSIHRPIGKPALFNSDAKLINELIGFTQYIKRIHWSQIKRSEDLSKQAISLINEIEKSYHLK